MVPDGWQQMRVGEALKIDNTKRKPVSAEERATMQGSYPYYGPTKVQDWINGYAYNGRYALIGEDGDHFLKYRTLRQTQIADGKFNVNNHAHVLMSSTTCTADWFYYYFQNRSIESYLTRQGAKRYKLNKASLEIIPMLVPPLHEQIRITKILSTWDQAIETTEKLIASSEAQKKALMQQLLTGKKRLPGFDGKWTKHNLKELGSTFGGLAGKTKKDFGQGAKYIPYKNIFQNAEIDFDNLDYVDVSPSENQNEISHGDIFFTTSSETPDEVGMTSVAIDPSAEIYLNSFCFGFRPYDLNKISPHFAKHYFRSGTIRRSIVRLAQGSTRYNLSKKYLMEIELNLPSIEEQAALADIIDNAEKSQLKLQNKLVQLKKEKSALMQQLLTGKRRVKTNEIAA